MYAVIKTGGKQYRVSAGDKLRVESLPVAVGAEVAFQQVLMVAEGEKVSVGQPVVAGASVKGTVIAHGRGDKIRIFKHRRRKHFKKQAGHRQNYTEVEISAITAG